MELVKKDLFTEEYHYDTAQERYDHINSYGLNHLIYKIGGDGVTQPLFAIFNAKERE